MPGRCPSWCRGLTLVAAAALLAGACGASPSATVHQATPTVGTTQPPTTTAPLAVTSSPSPATTRPVTSTAAPATTAAPSTTAPPTTAAATTTTTRPQPPYTVTEITIPLVDTSRPTVANGQRISSSRALTTLVWAPSAPGRWPLVVFAHGFEVGPTPYIGLLEHWASEGYVVAAPEFPLTDQAVAGADLDENDLVNQPQDVRFVTDALVAASSPVAGRIDPSRVAVAGHSDGAETALSASIQPSPPGEPAYKAVIVMAGQPVTSGRSANPPILVTQGDADTTNPPQNGYDTYAQASSPKYLEVLHGAGHLPPEEVGTAWYPALSGVTTAFLNDYVAGTGSQAAIIAAGSQSPYGSIQSG